MTAHALPPVDLQRAAGIKPALFEALEQRKLLPRGKWLSPAYDQRLPLHMTNAF